MMSYYDEFCPRDVRMRDALVSDHDAILNITKDENLFGGTDYLQYCLMDWLVEGRARGERRNLVFTLHDKVIGFRSLLFQNNFQLAFSLAFRIKPELRGKQFGKIMTDMRDRKIKSEYPNGVSVISSMTDANISDKTATNPSRGSILLVLPCIMYRLRWDQLPTRQNIFSPSNEVSVYQISKDEFASLIRNETTRKNLTENGVIHINWEPFIPATQEDIELILEKNMIVMVEGDRTNPTSLSILSLPSRVSAGHEVALDLFNCPNSSVEKHLSEQLLAFREMEQNQVDGDVFLSIFLDHQSISEARQTMARMGLQHNTFIYGSINRHFNKMYVYRKNISDTAL